MSYPWPDLTTEEWEEALRKGQLPDPPPHVNAYRDKLSAFLLFGTADSGNWGHAGRPGFVGGSMPQKAPDSGSGGGATRRVNDNAKVRIVQTKREGPVTMRPATEADAERIKAVKTPPGWKDVYVSEDPTSGLQTIGTDEAGRTQRRYLAKFSAESDAEKFARGGEFNKALPQLRDRIEKDMTDTALPERERESAVMLHIIEQTALRPGSESDTGAKKKAYGITTLEGRHVKVEGDKVRFRFRGKDGVLNAKTIINPGLAREMERRLAKTGPKEQLFPVASDQHLRDYLHSRDGDFKPKDFRTWHGTNEARKVIAKMKPPEGDEKAFKKAQRQVAKVVAAHLGNTPAVALKSYIDPIVWGPWLGKKS